ncbi:MAG TPA: hypothetical protein VMB71_08450 [Acetobacteraceae bacterium]|nr:hypothetical protein [Acetobacteraceae bacterium]
MGALPSYPRAFDPALGYDSLTRAAREATGFDAAELAAKFESLGDDCEFGFFQRWCRAEVLGLFRFSNPHHDVILQEIESNFATFGEGMTVELDEQKPRREWIIVDPKRRLREHTYISEGQQPEEAVRRLSEHRTALLRRMMIENMRDGTKIFVIKSGEGRLNRDAVAEIAQALRRRGPNWLLWVKPGEKVGKVKVLAEGLIRGTIDRLTCQDGSEPSYAAWLAVVVGAYVEVSAQRFRGEAWRATT